MPLDAASPSMPEVLRQIGSLMEAALKFIPPARSEQTTRQWLQRSAMASASEQDLPGRLADAFLLVGDLLVSQPSSSGATAFDRAARARNDASPAEAAGLAALRQSRFRLLELDTSGTGARDLLTGERLHLAGLRLATAGRGVPLFARVAPLGDGVSTLPGAATPLDEAALAIARAHTAARLSNASANTRWAEAVYCHVVRHGTLEIPGVNRPADDAARPVDDDDPMAPVVRAWLALDGSAPGPDLLQRTRQLTSAESVIKGVISVVEARQTRDAAAAATFERLALVQMETVLRREISASGTLTLDQIAETLDDGIRRGGAPRAAGPLFAALRMRLTGGSARHDADDPALERLMTRIQGLRAKTVEQGCTEAEALAAAEKVAELLDRYGLSLGELDFRAQACEGIGIQTTRRRFAPIDSCIPAIAAFFDCRAWVEHAKGTALRYVFFGLRADVAAAQYLYEMVERAFDTEMETFRAGDIYGRMAGERRTATNSFQIGLARGICAKLRTMRDVRTSARRSATGRDLVEVKSAMVEDELAKLGLELRARGAAARPRHVLREAFAAGHEAGERFEFAAAISAAA